MENISNLELFGYFASILIVISLMMKSLLKLRWINLFGAGTMSIYGLLIKAYPVAILNGLIVAIDVYYLYQMFSAKDYFNTLQIKKDSKYLEYFLNFYGDEIKKFLPEFTYRVEEEQSVFLVLRNMVPAGVFILKPNLNNSLMITLDFVIPGYRDLKIGKFVYGNKSLLVQDNDITSFFTQPGTLKHEQYLRRMGFTPTDGDLYCLSI